MHPFLKKLGTTSRIQCELKLCCRSASNRVTSPSRRCFHNSHYLRTSTLNGDEASETPCLSNEIKGGNSNNGVDPDTTEDTQWGIPNQLKRDLRVMASMGEAPSIHWASEKELSRGLPPAPAEIAAVRTALQFGNPHMIFDLILNSTKVPGGPERLMTVFATLPPSSFTELLRCLNPDKFMGRYMELHREISPGMSRFLGLADAVDQDGIYTFAKHFLDNINLILDIRSLSHEPVPSDFKYLLQCARATGHVGVARTAWEKFHAAATKSEQSHSFVDDGVMIDVESYNDYLGVICWHDSRKPHQRSRLRLVPKNFAPRAWSAVPYTLAGHSFEGLGIAYQATMVFRQMIESGLSGDEQTFCLMMVALSREGGMVGVSSILKRVWDIDVQELVSSGNVAADIGAKYSTDSPFYPSPNLLLTIAHVFGTSNAVPTALKLVDFVSRKYGITIPNEVWKEMLRWTFVLSTPYPRSDEAVRRAQYDKEGNQVGKLPLTAVLNLWNTMISEPYNVKPTMEMYNQLIMTLSRVQRWSEMQFYMNEALKIYKRDCLNLYRQQTLYNIGLSRSKSSPRLLDLRKQDMAYHALRVARNKAHVRRWVSTLLLRGSKSLRSDDKIYEAEFIVREIPQIVDTWYMFLEDKTEYHVRLGFVELKTRSEKKLRYGRLASKHAATDSEKLEYWTERHWNFHDQRRAERLASLEANSPQRDQLESDQ